MGPVDEGFSYRKLQTVDSDGYPLRTITHYLAGGKDDSSVDAPIVFHFSLLSWGFHEALLTEKCACRNLMLIHVVASGHGRCFWSLWRALQV